MIKSTAYQSESQGGQFSVIENPFCWSIFGYQNHLAGQTKKKADTYDAALLAYHGLTGIW
ncbi:MAG: hypothetical protein GY801_18730, partial [bacterium]|nr:hypothetical protein [bacterium]